MPPESPLLTDLYQLNMIQAYLDHGDTQTAVFEFFVRTLPRRRGISARRRPRPGARLSGELALLRGRHRMAQEHRSFQAQYARLSRGIPFHRQRPRHAGRHRILRQRTDPAHHRTAAGGAVRRNPADQHPAFPVAWSPPRPRAASWPRPESSWSISASAARTAPRPD